MAKKRSKSPKYQAAKVKRTRAKEKKVKAQARITTLKGKLKTVKSPEKKALVKARLAKAKTRRKKAGAQMKSQAAVMKDPYAKTVKKKVVKKKVVKKKKKVATKKDATTTKKVDTRQRTTGFNEYQIPDRTFDWETDPSEQALFASAIGRPDLAKTMLTGQYGPLAGQQYKYGAGRTRINYGPGRGYGAGAGAGLGGTGGRLGPLGGAGADTAAAAVVNPDVARQDWWPPGATNARMAAWMRDTGGTPLEWTESLPKLGESLAGLRGLFGLGGREAATTTPGYTGPGSKWADYGSPMGFEDVKARAARTPSVSPPSGYPDFASGALSPTRNIRSGMALTTPEVGTGVNDITPWGLSSLGYPDYAGGAITPTTPVQVGMGTGYAPTTTLDRFINPARSSGITPFEATGGAPVYGSLGSLGVTPFESTGGADVMFGTPYTGGTGFRR